MRIYIHPVTGVSASRTRNEIAVFASITSRARDAAEAEHIRVAAPS